MNERRHGHARVDARAHVRMHANVHVGEYRLLNAGVRDRGCDRAHAWCRTAARKPMSCKANTPP